MPAAPFPPDEKRRLAALRGYDILYTENEADFDELVQLASQICGTEVALISLLEADHQWFKAQTGYIEAKQTSREVSFCAYTILQDDEMEVPDAWEDLRFVDNELVHQNVVRSYTGTPLTDSQGNRLGSLCVIDRKPVKLDEQQLFALRTLGKQVVAQIELRKKVQDLDQKLIDEQQALEREKAAKLEALHANQIKSRFLAHMSHEIRTPLHGMTGLIEMLEETSLSPQQQELVHLLQNSTHNLRGIIDDILDLAKLEAGKSKLHFVPTDLGELARDIQQLFAPAARSKGLALTLDIDAALPTYVRADAGKVKQILSNLLSNALKFTEQGTISLRVTWVKQAAGKVWVRWEVQDTGTGISQERQQHIFDEFEQESEEIASKYGGTGLGMAIVKRLVEMMEGSIGVVSPLPEPQSEGGAGTLFGFELPLKICNPTQTQAAAVSRTKADDWGTFRILVAEDNLVNQKIIARHLRKLGVAHDLAANGQEAIGLLARENYDLILMDISMPAMDGEEATRLIRQELQLTLPIVALTANVLQADRDRYHQIGMNGWLGKPFSREELRQTLATHFSQLAK